MLLRELLRSQVHTINRPLLQAVLTCAISKVPRRSRVAASAHREIVAAKRALAIMTGHATLSAAGGVMIQRFRRRNLSALRQARFDLMTFVAVYLLMLQMVEAYPECLSRFGSP